MPAQEHACPGPGSVTTTIREGPQPLLSQGNSLNNTQLCLWCFSIWCWASQESLLRRQLPQTPSNQKKGTSGALVEPLAWVPGEQSPVLARQGVFLPGGGAQ